jgi:SAM-dependent methyltransferase
MTFDSEPIPQLPLCDKEPPEIRKDTLKRIIFDRDIFTPQGFLDRGKLKGEVLDLGCGRGSVGGALAEINPEVEITGVDIITNYEGTNYLGQYKEVVSADAVEAVQEFSRIGRKFDFVIAVGLPEHVTEGLIDSGQLPQIVCPGGVALLIFDIPVKHSVIYLAGKEGFTYRHGRYLVDDNILCYQKEENDPSQK